MIYEALSHLCSVVNTVIPVSLDQRNLNPPCAWVAGRRLADFTLDMSRVTMYAEVYIITRDVGTEHAIKELSAATSAVIGALFNAGIAVQSVALDEAAVLPEGGGPMPAYRIEVKV